MIWKGPPSELALPSCLPVFPLPTVVFFPGTVVPLHVFEPRYQEMVRDVRRSHGFITLALLKPGWEPEYYGSPEVHRVGCAGRLLAVEDLAGGRSNIKLAGVSRVRIQSFETEQPYRQALVKQLPENLPTEEDDTVQEARTSLVAAYALLFSEVTGQPASDLEGARSAPFHALVNTLCATIDLPPPAKQALLKMDDVLERCQTITALLQKERHRHGGGGSLTVH